MMLLPQTRSLIVGSLSLTMLSLSSITTAQTNQSQDGELLEEIIVTGIRRSLQSALLQKQASDNLIEVIQAEDIGKLPDQNLAEVLENITGVQITRTAGVGTGVQIRGTSANRVEINGVSTVGSGAGRSGINFEDVNASIINSVEVTKASEAKTIEGSVGGTVNLKTIRPLALTETLGSIRIQGEDSSLSTESIQPRISGAWGDNWETSSGGRFGVVLSGSFTEQEAVSFRPRADRDNIGSIPGFNPEEFLGIQFLLQEQENDDFETTNLAGTFEWAPNDNTKFFFDAVINEQERSRDQYRLQASGVSTLINISQPTAFETVDFGSAGGLFPAALSGTLEPDLANDDDDPNLRFSSETNSRITDTEIFRLGGEWQNERLFVSAELASTTSDSVTPSLNTTLNFINPNCPLDGSSNDNCVPFVYDLSGGSLAFGVNFDSPFAPSVADLTNPANVVLDQVDQTANTTENEDNALRVDLSYALAETGFTSLDFGVRYNEASTRFEDIDGRIGGFSALEDSPNGLLFSDLLVTGPTNFGSADGRDLFISDFLLVDPDRSFTDPEGVIAVLEAALAEHRLSNPDADGDLILELESDQNSFYQIDEDTTALYVQGNFASGDFRGNIGVRYIDTDIASIGFSPIENANGDRVLQRLTSNYDFLLPRLNLVYQPNDEWIFRAGYGEDIRRPDFDQLSSGFSADESENADIEVGNPDLVPEEVDSFDIAAEWYFAPAAVASIGAFVKERDGIIRQSFEGAALISDPSVPGGLVRETDPNCPGGGIFNPIAQPNVLGDPNTFGLCVDQSTFLNDGGTTTQSGIEIAFQYDLSNFEDRLGWASGFGIVANATFQDFSGDSEIRETSGRGETVLGEQAIPQGLLDFSETAYNFTLFYEKYGISARARYTWREAFRTEDFGGGANTSGSSTFSFPVVTDDRGQLNASISYDVNDNLNVGVEVVNLTEERIEQNCVTGEGPLCFVGFPDRRITFGANYNF